MRDGGAQWDHGIRLRCWDELGTRNEEPDIEAAALSLDADLEDERGVVKEDAREEE